MEIKKVENKIPPGFKLQCTLRGPKGRINRIAWSPDGQTLASTFNETIRLWDIRTGELRPMRRHTDVIYSVAWSPDGQTLASASRDQTLRIWDIETKKMILERKGHSGGIHNIVEAGRLRRTLKGHSGSVYSVVWSPDGELVASGSADETVRLWSVNSGELYRTLLGHSNRVYSVVWSPDGQTIASGSRDQTLRLWDVGIGKLRRTLKGHSGSIYSVAWSPDRKLLASGAGDETIRLWDSESGQEIGIIEGHIAAVTSLAFSFDGRLLASGSTDGTVRLWRCDTWEAVSVLNEQLSGSPGIPMVTGRSSRSRYAKLLGRLSKSSFHEIASLSWFQGLAFHTRTPVLATAGEEHTVIHVWDLNLNTLFGIAPLSQTVYYTNAKVLLVGDTGVGKSCLGLVLTGQPFAPQPSTHGRHVWTLNSQEVQRDDGRVETRETLLWDLAGQPGYRLIHQLHLDEVAVALVVFDARSETDPFAGVRHWDRALRQAQRIQGDSALLLKKILVAARTDRGGISVSRERIETLVREWGFDEYFETSAKEGWNIAELDKAICEAIVWEALPKVSSPELFQNIKAFLIAEKEARRLLSTVDDLYRAFLKSAKTPVDTDERRAQFETCIGRVEARGLIRRLSFGNLILLQPELLDAYASAMINTAKEEPDGLGSIVEENAREGRFRIPTDERIKDKEREKLLLIATVEELLRREIALREPADDGPHLIFPSQFTREHPDLPDPEGKAVIFSFDGPLLNIYATLAVRLSHSGVFKKKEMWKNAATYTARVGGTCGMFLREIEEARGELTLFFDMGASEETRFQFEEYVYTHLQRRALPESIHRRRIFMCPECGTPVTDLQEKRRREHGLNWINCNVCEPSTRILLLDREERLPALHPSAIPEMDRAADTRRKEETAASILQGKIATGDFDVFLAHNSQDKHQVEAIAEELKRRGLNPWLDKEQIPPGQWFQDVIQKAIQTVKSAAIFIGLVGLGKWQTLELRSFISQCVDKNLPVIPVLLPGATRIPLELLFLQEFNRVRFIQKTDEVEALDALEWGIRQASGENI